MKILWFSAICHPALFSYDHGEEEEAQMKMSLCLRHNLIVWRSSMTWTIKDHNSQAGATISNDDDVILNDTANGG